MSKNEVEIAVIGGGIGGLSAAVLLNQAGYDAHVYEQAPVYLDIGGHLNIDSYTIAVLARAGLEDAFRKMACLCPEILIKKIDSGEEIMTVPFLDIGSLGVDAPDRMGTRVINSFMRSDLLDLLKRHIPEGKLHVDHKLIELEGRENGAVASFDNGEEVSASIVIAADGVRSLARKKFDDVPATKGHYSILRTSCAIDVVPEELRINKFLYWDGSEYGDLLKGEDGAALLTAPVRNGTVLSLDLQFQGGDLFEDCDPLDIPLDRVMARYPETLDPVVKDMIDSRLEPISAYPLYDRPVAEKWVEGRIVLLGDAAHSMRPYLAQGACQSIQDAGAILDAFSEFGLTHEALKSYEALRKPFTQSIVEAARNAPSNPKVYKDIDEAASL
ncbi:MAG: FAD-dependent oxidoreductase [Pseudomonadales bacterium]